MGRPKAPRPALAIARPGVMLRQWHQSTGATTHEHEVVAFLGKPPPSARKSQGIGKPHLRRQKI